jgi:hypothetical protein
MIHPRLYPGEFPGEEESGNRRLLASCFIDFQGTTYRSHGIVGSKTRDTQFSSTPVYVYALIQGGYDCANDRDGGGGGVESRNQLVLFFQKAESLDTAFARDPELWD